MAPQRPYSPRDASSFDKLPEDVLSSVLQLLPAKELCRLRTVCSSWRSITSGQAFIRAHADRHKEPLFLAKFRDDKTHVYVVDLSGNVVKRIAGADGGLQVMRTRLNLACLATERNTCRVLNPATCRVLNPPTGGIHLVLPVVANRVIRPHNHCTFFALGLVASTGEYKLLRCLNTFNPCAFAMLGSRPSMVEVLTINGGTDHALWRPRPGPHVFIDVRSGVVVDGVVYFLTSAVYDANNGGMPAHYNILPLDLSRWRDNLHGSSSTGNVTSRVVCHNMALYHTINARMPADHILSFDLASEEWRRDLHGPSSTGNLTSGQMLRSQLTLADLKGSLVLAHHPRSSSIMDLWFLLDFESSLWEKQYSIRTESVTTSLAAEYHLIPLLALHDGRLVIHLAPTGLLFICDPGTNTFTMVDMRHRLDSFAVYTGSLLSLQEGDMV